MKLANAIEIKSRFTSSINLERDTSKGSLAGYIPTGRALDVVRRLAHGVADSSLGRSISITGPHGGGKSSLAVFIDCLVSPSSSKEYKDAVGLLQEFDAELSRYWVDSIKTLKGSSSGFYKAVATANREPIIVSLLRALQRATEDKNGPNKDLHRKINALDIEGDIEPHTILSLVKELASIKPIIFVVDEFGKNLEAYVDSPAKGDPYILQALSELGQGSEALPIFIVTLQHLSFDEYVQGTTVGQRREWAKIQGRFQDIPFIESALQSRRLVASVFTQKDSSIKTRYKKWLDTHKSLINESGLGDIAKSPDTPSAFPLDPLTLAVLPPLCSRYGQNERTLFSFLASKEKSSVASYMAEREFSKTGELEFVGLDRVYDYFLESASTLLSTSTTASRWLEIETRIRDAQGLTIEEMKVLKSIGILNLISSGGALRATKSVLKLTLADTTLSVAQLEKKSIKILEKLEEKGLVVYRAFADEYRIWQGSDFDLRTAVEIARKSISQTPLHKLLNDVSDLGPVVAARASQDKGVLRVFRQVFADLSKDTHLVTQVDDHIDGVVVFSTSASSDLKKLDFKNFEKPIVVLIPQDLDLLHDIALEVTAIHQVLNQSTEQGLDWVARKELVERYVVVKQKLQEVTSTAWLSSSNWFCVAPKLQKLDSSKGLSFALSIVTDLVYSKTPRVSNEMIARRELTGQGAKARRTLLDSIRTSSSKEAFGITGFGPDRAIYEALFRSTGLHAYTKSAGWQIKRPTDPLWAEAWDVINHSVDGATKERVSVSEIQDLLSRAPYGLKEGVLPLLSFAVITSRKNDLAIYEHGTLILDLDDAVLERLAKNPSNFTLRNYAAKSKSRSLYLSEIVNAFGISNADNEDTFIQIVKALYREIYALNPYTKNTKAVLSRESIGIRQAFLTASEPDRLLFEQIPEIIGFAPIYPETKLTAHEASKAALSIAEFFRELKSAYPQLLETIRTSIAEATSTNGELALMRKQLQGQATNLEGRVLDRSLHSFVVAIQRDELSNQEWLENLAMVTLDGSPSRSWNDEDINLFSVKIYEVGGALKRLQALLYDRLSKSETPFEAIRITLTHPDGSEVVDVVSITEQEKVQISNVMGSATEQLESMFGSSSAGKSALLAWLTSQESLSDKNETGKGKAKKNA
jgi:energy-coupling factor transporter ATP-binding protein EcfA2